MTTKTKKKGTAKGRPLKNGKLGRSTYSDELVAKVKALLKAGKQQREVAKLLGVAQSGVCRINRLGKPVRFRAGSQNAKLAAKGKVKKTYTRQAVKASPKKAVKAAPKASKAKKVVAAKPSKKAAPKVAAKAKTASPVKALKVVQKPVPEASETPSKSPVQDFLAAKLNGTPEAPAAI